MAHYLVKTSGKEFDISVEYHGDKYLAVVNGTKHEINYESLGGSRMLMLLDNRSSEIDIRANSYDNHRTVFIRGQEVDVEVEDFRLAQVKKAAGISIPGSVVKAIKAPMPGLVLEVKVNDGDRVSGNQPLLVIEAMKMENVIKATGEAVIKKVAVVSGQSVEKNDLLIEFA